MIPYYLLLFPICAILLAGQIAPPSRQLRIGTACVLILTLFAGMRGYVGIDTYTYHVLFRNNIHSSPTELLGVFEPVFVLVAKSVSLISTNSFAFTFTVALLQGVVLFILARTSISPTEFLVIYVSLFYVNLELNTIRAGLGLLLFILATRIEHRANKKLFYLILLGALLSHFSTIVGILPLLLVRGKGTRGKIFAFVLGIVSILAVVWFILNDPRQMAKIAGYLEMENIDALSYGVGLFSRILLYISLLLCVITKENRRSLILLFSTWVALRIAMVELMMVDRIEVIASAVFIFSALQIESPPSRRRLRSLTVILLVASGLASTLNMIGSSSASVARGSVLNFEHEMSPFNPYKFFWEEPDFSRKP